MTSLALFGLGLVALLSTIAALTDAQPAYVGSAENGVDLEINSAATGKVMVNGVDIVALVAAQASRIEALKNASALCGGVTISSDAELAMLAPATRSCLSISTLTITGVGNTSLLVDAFRTLAMVTGDLRINNNPNLLDLGEAFPVLLTVTGRLNIENNDALTDLGEAFPVLATVGNFRIQYNPGLTDLGRAFPMLATVGGDLYVTNSARDISQAFPSLATVIGTLQIQNNGNLADLGRSFPVLATIGHQLNIQNNDALTDFGEAFPALATVGNTLGIYTNRQLISIGSCFASLQTVGNLLKWYNNGRPATTARSVSTSGTQAFCSSARATLCPTTTNHWGGSYADDANNCCTAYCATPAAAC